VPPADRKPEGEKPAPAGEPGRAVQLEQARDEVELLEVQLEVRQAQLRMAQASQEAARRRIQTGGFDSQQGRAKAEEELLVMQAQLQVKTVELKEPELRLTQARRRLARLEKAAHPPAADPRARQEELEKKLEALSREVEALRREFRRPPDRQ
jgi:hypothetical protein